MRNLTIILLFICSITFGQKVITYPYWETQWYGVEIDESSSSPDLTRIASDMHTHARLPVHSLIKACLLNDDGTVNYYLDPNDWSKKVSGAVSNLDGTDGQVMIEFPDFYYKVESDAGKHQIKISLSGLAGYKKVFKHYVSAYQAALNRDTLTLASVKNTSVDYRGGDNNATVDADYNTRLGMPATKIAKSDFRTYANNRGRQWNMIGYSDYKWITWLFVIEYATLNSQKAVDPTLTAEGYKQGGLGLGVEGLVLADWNTHFEYNPFVPCGKSDALASGTGEVDYTVPTWGVTVKVNRYRGIEMPFGHEWSMLDGVNVNAQSAGDGGVSTLYVSDDPATWNDDNLIDYDNRGAIARGNGFVEKTLLGEYADFIRSEAGGSVSTYYTDYSWNEAPPSTQIQTVRTGVYAAFTTKYAGLFSTYINRSLNASVNILTRLAYRSPVGCEYLADMSYTDSQHCLEEFNGKIYRFGGVNKKYEVYDPVTNIWTDLGDMPIGFMDQEYRQSSVARKVGDKIYHIGGLNGGIISNVSHECWEYTPATDEWVQKADMPTAREDFGSAVLGTKIYCFGGVISNGGFTDGTDVLEIYDTETNTWDTTKASMPDKKLLGDFGASYGGKIYAIGGYNTMATYPVLAPVTTVYEYDPDLDVWNTKTPIPFSTCYKEVAVIGDKFYIISGAGAGVTTTTTNHSCAIFEYDVPNDTWTRKYGAPYAVLGSALAVYNGEVYMCGGNPSTYGNEVKTFVKFTEFYDR